MTGTAWRALRVERGADGAATVALRDDETDASLESGDVWIDVSHSSLNFKDALALTGRPGIVRPDSLIAGIDLVGTVTASDSPDSSVGDRVLVNGCGLGETHHGGLAERARVDAEWLVPVPGSISLAQAAAIGTAGFTAMLAVLELERAGALGDVVVTGAAGGVGSIAISLLARLGARVTAVTGRPDEEGFLRALGASAIEARSDFEAHGKPLQSSRWDGAVDTVGGDILSTVLSQLRYGGTAAACGNASSSTLTASIMPFILRATRLVGINSVATPRALRLDAWERLGAELDLELLDSLTTTIGLGEAIGHAELVLAGKVRGRTVVDVRA